MAGGLPFAITPFPSVEQLREYLSDLVKKLEELGVKVSTQYSERPIFVEAGVVRDGDRVVLTRLDLYATTVTKDMINLLPPLEYRHGDGLIERRIVAHLVQGVCVKYTYVLEGEYRLIDVTVILVGRPYRELATPRPQ